MGYASLLLKDGDTLEAIHIAHMEKGIKEAHDNLDGIEVSLKEKKEENGREIKVYEMTLPNGNAFTFEVEDGKDGEKGDAGNVNINDKTPLRFFAGTKAQYDDLPDKTNVFAIITDDPTQIGLIDKINGFIDGSIPIPNIEQNYVRKDEKKIFSFFGNDGILTENKTITLSEIPTGKTIDDIVGIGIKTRVDFDSSTFGFFYSATLQFSANKANMSSPQGMRFILSAISHDSSSSGSSLVNPVGMATMVVSLGVTAENKVTITFDECSYTLFDADQFLSAKLSDNIFKLLSIVYYFA